MRTLVVNLLVASVATFALLMPGCSGGSTPGTPTPADRPAADDNAPASATAEAPSEPPATPTATDESLPEVGTRLTLLGGRGETVWSVVYPAPGFYVAAVAGNIFASTDDSVVALDRRTGQELWAVPKPNPTDVVLGADAEGVYLSRRQPDGKDAVVALDPDTGSERWSVTMTGYVDGDGAVLSGGAIVSSARDEMNSAGLVTATDTKSGETRWTTSIEGFASAPWAGGGPVFLDGGGGLLYALDAATGEVRWTSPKRGAGFGGEGPLLGAADNQNVYSTTYSGDGASLLTVALKSEDGSEVWRLESPHGGSFGGASVVAAAGLVITGGGQGLIALDADDGSAAWELPLPKSERIPGCGCDIAFDTAAVYVSEPSAIRAYALADAHLLWEAQTTGVALLTTGDGLVFAIRPAPPADDRAELQALAETFATATFQVTYDVVGEGIEGKCDQEQTTTANGTSASVSITSRPDGPTSLDIFDGTNLLVCREGDGDAGSCVQPSRAPQDPAASLANVLPGQGQLPGYVRLLDEVLVATVNEVAGRNIAGHASRCFDLDLTFPGLGSIGTVCATASEGVITLVEGGVPGFSGTIVATSFSTTVPSGAFEPPYPVTRP